MSQQNELLKELVAVRIKRVLARGTQYERNFYNQVGRGVTPQEFTEVLDKLVGDGVIKRTSGQKPGTTILSFAEPQQQR